MGARCAPCPGTPLLHLDPTQQVAVPACATGYDEGLDFHHDRYHTLDVTTEAASRATMHPKNYDRNAKETKLVASGGVSGVQRGFKQP